VEKQQLLHIGRASLSVAVEKQQLLHIGRASLSLTVVVKLSPAGALGGISNFVLQNFHMNTNKLQFSIT
jgi:hypothetical protein